MLDADSGENVAVLCIFFHYPARTALLLRLFNGGRKIVLKRHIYKVFLSDMQSMPDRCTLYVRQTDSLIEP